MKSLRKIVLSILTVVMMLLVLSPSVPLRAEDEEVESYNLWVGGVEVTAENKDDILDDGGKAKFDPASGTLTLDNPTFAEGLGVAIYAKDFSLSIEGDVNAVGTTFGIYVENNRLTIDKGKIYAEGEIAIACKELVINDGDITAVNVSKGQSDSVAVYADKTIAIISGKLTANAKGTDDVYAIRANELLHIVDGEVTATVETSGGTLSNAIGLSSDKIEITDGIVDITATNNGYNAKGIEGNTTIKGGDVAIKTEGGYCYGISEYNFTMSGGKLQIECKSRNDGAGISATYGEIDISDGELIINCTGKEIDGIDSDENITISGGKVTVTATGESAVGINCWNWYTDAVKITISGGEVSTTASGNYTIGLFTNKPLTISGGTVMGKGASHGLYSEGNLTIGNGITSVTADGKEEAISTENKIILGNELTIKEPTNGKLSDDNTTVVDANGKVSTHAVIVNDNKYTITVKQTENGEVTASRGKANEGDIIALTVSPEENCVLDSLKVEDAAGNEVSVRKTDDGYEFTMPESDVTVTAVFIRYYAISVAEDSMEYIGVDKESAAAGETVTVSLKEVDGYVVKDIIVTDEEGNRVEVSEDHSFTMPASEVTVAAEVAKLYAVTIEESENGTVSASSLEAEAEEVVSLTISPEESCKLDSIRVTDADGNDVALAETDDGYEFTMPESDVTVTAVFIRYYAINVSEETAEYIDIAQESAAAGETVTVELKEVNGYIVKDIIVTDAEGNEIAVDEDYSFTMPASEVTVTVEVAKMFTLTFNLNGGYYNGESTYIVEYEEGTVIKLPKPVRNGFTFEYWQGSKYYAGDSYTVTEDHVFKAMWKLIPAEVTPFSIPQTGVE